MSVLGKGALIEAMNQPSLEERLIVTPIFDEAQIGPGSIDVRIGHEFITTRRGNLSAIDPAKILEKDKGRYEQHYYVERGEQFVLHPNELVLAATMEWFRLPTNISGYVTSRSSWGRCGLIVATAVAVHPGFSGAITLELLNVGEVPIVLYPGLPIAQFVGFSCDGGGEYEGVFAAQGGPNTAYDKRDEDQDRKFWTSKESV